MFQSESFRVWPFKCEVSVAGQSIIQFKFPLLEVIPFWAKKVQI